MNYKPNPPRILILGNYYIVYYTVNKPILCKFIQPTRCGFNFLDINTNKCILKHHIYPSKCENHKSGNWFFINSNLSITDLLY